MSDMITYRQPLLQDTSFRSFWDNLSDNLLRNDNDTGYSLSECTAACENDDTCLQFSHTQNECRLGSYVVNGHEVPSVDVDFTSGWDRNKIGKMGFAFTKDRMYSTCESVQWKRPIIHWWTETSVAPGPTALSEHES